MRVMRIVALVATVVFFPNQGTGQTFLSGNQLHENCSSTSLADKQECIGYVIGVLDALGSLPKPMFCIPLEVVSRQQVSDVVRRWLENHPEKRHYAANSLVFHAISQAFPCRK